MGAKDKGKERFCNYTPTFFPSGVQIILERRVKNGVIKPHILTMIGDNDKKQEALNHMKNALGEALTEMESKMTLKQMFKILLDNLQQNIDDVDAENNYFNKLFQVNLEMNMYDERVELAETFINIIDAIFEKKRKSVRDLLTSIANFEKNIENNQKKIANLQKKSGNESIIENLQKKIDADHKLLNEAKEEKTHRDLTLEEKEAIANLYDWRKKFIEGRKNVKKMIKNTEMELRNNSYKIKENRKGLFEKAQFKIFYRYFKRKYRREINEINLKSKLRREIDDEIYYYLPFYLIIGVCNFTKHLIDENKIVINNYLKEYEATFDMANKQSKMMVNDFRVFSKNEEVSIVINQHNLNLDCFDDINETLFRKTSLRYKMEELLIHKINKSTDDTNKRKEAMELISQFIQKNTLPTQKELNELRSKIGLNEE